MESHSVFKLQPTFFHSEEWLGLLRELYGYERLDLNTRGFRMPLLRVGPLFGDRLISIPFSDYGGPVGGVCAEELHRGCVDLLQRSGAEYVEIRTDNQPLTRALLELGFTLTATYFSRVLNTHPEAGWEEAWKLSLDKKARQGVVKAEKAGISVSEATADSEVDAAYHIYFKSVKSIGSPCHPRALFDSIRRRLGKHARIYLAERGGRRVGMAIYLIGEEKAHLWARYALDEYKKLGVVYLLDWEGVKLANTLKIKWFDFGRTRRNSGVEVYKHHWRGDDSAIYHLCLPRRGKANPPDPAQTSFRLYSTLWRVLPDPVVNAVGPRVIRCIAL